MQPTTTVSQHQVITRILTLFEQLPPDAAVTVHEIFELLAAQTASRLSAESGHSLPIYPTRTSSANVVLNLAEACQIQYEGDSFLDTESVLDED